MKWLVYLALTLTLIIGLLIGYSMRECQTHITFDCDCFVSGYEVLTTRGGYCILADDLVRFKTTYDLINIKPIILCGR